MDANSTNVTLSEGNSTLNSAVPAGILDRLLKPDFLILEAKVILSALSIIWLAAHASLRRPPSAAPSKKKGKDVKDIQFTEGLVASDAIMFPVMAAIVLVGLYYLMEYLQDPDVLNKILRVYISIIAIAGMGRLAADALNILTSIVFPDMWVDRQGRLHTIGPKDESNGAEVTVPARSPFPGVFGRYHLSDRLVEMAWEVRHLFTEEWTARFAVHGLVFVKFNLRLNSLLGILIAILVSIAYHVMDWHILANLIGSAITYSSFSLLFPTSFAIGSMVLWGLFVYDIVMVFYTPFMITVAKNVDAPIKLVFHGPSGVSLLGLGDIVVPGLLLGLALRFDLYRHYQKKIKLEPVELTKEVQTHGSGGSVATVDVQYKKVKAAYVDSQGQWGNRFWTTPLGRLFPVRVAVSVWEATAFPKPYFYAAFGGYFLGMLVTLSVMAVFQHGQPALLYLVPGVTGSLWLTAVVRGELKEFWAYTEDGSLDVADVVVEVDADGQVVKEIKKSKAEDVKGEDGEEEKEKPGAEKGKDGDYEVFLFSITAPRRRVAKQD
ncbi:signal peptide peptidase-domain-containing protein [Echria macrotheca]|uniref:Signal peptide peptidase-domain-containing protein n=1 Tax=Echria macrotheca TaxID=438768 RepID=A0AAJ0BMM0_9PEZI|nr:signal peptide peptidase-domain-containing protein [Echria macrotheca]